MTYLVPEIEIPLDDEREREMHHNEINKLCSKFLLVSNEYVITFKVLILLTIEVEWPKSGWGLESLVAERKPNHRNPCSIETISAMWKDFQAYLKVII